MEIALHDEPTSPYLEPLGDGVFRFHADISCDLHNFLLQDDVLNEAQRGALVALWEDPAIGRKFEQGNGLVFVRLTL